MLHAPQVFDAQAKDYEQQRRGLIPPYGAFYETAVEALALAGRPLHRVLDLGAGTGLLARAVAERLPDAELTLLDGAPAMLKEARAVLGDRARYRRRAPDRPASRRSLGRGHQRTRDPPPRRHRQACAVRPPTRRTGAGRTHRQRRTGLRLHTLLQGRYSAWHQRHAHQAGASPDEWAGYEHRTRLDRWATVEDQLTWLRDAGFADTDCLLKHHCFAVLVARRAIWS